MRLNERDRFFAKVDRNGPVPEHCPELGPCHLWMASHDKKGYGQFRFEGKMRRAHRFAFFLANGRWPEPCGCHRCDNRGCVNDAHIFEGTDADNAADRDAKGRRTAPRGELNGAAKMTTPAVLQMRAEFDAGNVTKAHLARKFSMSERQVSDIVRGRKWAHLSADGA